MCVCTFTRFNRDRLCDPVDCSPPGSSVHGIFQQEYWSGLPCPPPWDLSDPGIESESPASPVLQADSLLLSHQGSLPEQYLLTIMLMKR